MKYYFLQLTNNDCGFCALKIILANINSDRNYLFLTQNLQIGNYSFKQLIDIAKKYDLTLQGYEVSELTQIKKYPLITLITINNVSHYIVLYKVKKNRVYFIDPKKGKSSLKIDEFNNIWSKKILQIESFSKHKCTYYVKPDYKEHKVTLIFNIILSAILFLIMFLNKHNQSSPLFLLVGLVIILIFNSIVKINILKKYDIEELYPSIENKFNQENITFEYQLKTQIFEYQNKTLLTSSIFTFLLFSLLLDSIFHSISVLIIFLSIYLIKKISLNQDESYKINLLENNLDIDSLKKANSLAYQHINKLNFAFVLVITIIIFLSYIMSHLISNPNLFSYYGIIYYLIYNELNTLINLDNIKIELTKNLLIHKLNKTTKNKRT